jgi:hypothetical protein
MDPRRYGCRAVAVVYQMSRRATMALRPRREKNERESLPMALCRNSWRKHDARARRAATFLLPAVSPICEAG